MVDLVAFATAIAINATVGTTSVQIYSVAGGENCFVIGVMISVVIRQCLISAMINFSVIDRKGVIKLVCKPSSVLGDHLSEYGVAAYFKRFLKQVGRTVCFFSCT